MSSSQLTKFVVAEKGTQSFLRTAIQSPSTGEHEFVKDLNDARLYETRGTATAAMNRVLAIPPVEKLVAYGDNQKEASFKVLGYRIWVVMDSANNSASEKFYYNGSKRDALSVLGSNDDFKWTRNTIKNSTEQAPDLEVFEVQLIRQIVR